jgi:hypothetical protein
MTWSLSIIEPMRASWTKRWRSRSSDTSDGCMIFSARCLPVLICSTT